MLRVNLSNYAIDLPKDKLHSVFPNSLLDNAAELGDDVDITQPLVTPSLLQLLQQILTSGKIPSTIPSDVDYVKASTYLNIPLLVALADPWFPTFRFLDPNINTVPI